jgi:hypothetical protein
MPSASSHALTRRPPALGPDKISLARLPVTGSDLFGREEDLAFLDDAWADQQVNVVTIVAWAGSVSPHLSTIGSAEWLLNTIVLRNSFLAGPSTDRAAVGTLRPQANSLPVESGLAANQLPEIRSFASDAIMRGAGTRRVVSELIQQIQPNQIDRANAISLIADLGGPKAAQFVIAAPGTARDQALLILGSHPRWTRPPWTRSYVMTRTGSLFCAPWASQR